MEKAIVILNLYKRGEAIDLEVPLNITANELVTGINSAYELGIDTSDVKNCFLRAENPIMLLRGEKTLAEFGVRNGTRINIVE